MRVAIKKHKRKHIAFFISLLTHVSVALLFASAVVPAGSIRWYLQPIQVAYPYMLSQENLLGLPAQSSTEMERASTRQQDQQLLLRARRNRRSSTK